MFTIDYLLWQVIAADLVDFMSAKPYCPTLQTARRIESSVRWLSGLVDEGRLRPDEFKSLAHSGLQRDCDAVARWLGQYGDEAYKLRIGVAQLMWDCVEVNPYTKNIWPRAVFGTGMCDWCECALPTGRTCCDSRQCLAVDQSYCDYMDRGAR